MISISTSLFWGIIIIVIGLLIVLKMFPAFRSLPIGRIIAGVILIYIGVTLIIGRPILMFNHNHNMHSFNFDRHNKEFFNDNYLNHDVIFNNKTIDLTKITDPGETRIKINVAFGSAHIKTNKTTRIIVNGSAAFGSIVLPGNNQTVFGHVNYATPESPEKKTAIYFNTNVAFGSLDISEE